MGDLRIAAFDGDDLEIISAHLQDGIVRIGDINFNAKTRQFVLVANRFAWEVVVGEAVVGEAVVKEKAIAPKKGLRKRTGVMFADVRGVKSHKIKQGVADAVVNLLAIEFDAGDDAPAGIIKLLFSGGGIIELDVECVEVVMEDLGPVWETENIPTHDDVEVQE